MMYSNNKKAAQGIGTLIIFISLILVSAIAAGVLLTTASSLQSKALDVGRQSQERLTTAIEVYEVKVNDVNDGSINPNNDNYSILLRLQSGSTPVKLNDTLIIIETTNSSQTLTFASGNVASTTQYVAEYLSGGVNSGYVVSGDLVQLMAVAGTRVDEEETLKIQVVNDNGAPIPVDITTPSVMVNLYQTLYP